MIDNATGVASSGPDAALAVVKAWLRPPRKNEVVFAAGFIGFVAADMNLRAVIRGWTAVDKALGKQGAHPTFGAVRCHPHTAVFGKQREVRRGSERLAAEIEGKSRGKDVVAVVEKIADEAEESGVAPEELDFIESDDVVAATGG